MRTLNPLQMRRAVRDYRYEVNESKMSDECVQYLAQLQKDWERRRVKMGVEALRKEVSMIRFVCKAKYLMYVLGRLANGETVPIVSRLVGTLPPRLPPVPSSLPTHHLIPRPIPTAHPLHAIRITRPSRSLSARSTRSLTGID